MCMKCKIESRTTNDDFDSKFRLLPLGLLSPAIVGHRCCRSLSPVATPLTLQGFSGLLPDQDQIVNHASERSLRGVSVRSDRRGSHTIGASNLGFLSATSKIQQQLCSVLACVRVCACVCACACVRACVCVCVCVCVNSP